MLTLGLTDLEPEGCHNAQLGLVEPDAEVVPHHHPEVAAHGEQAATSRTAIQR